MSVFLTAVTEGESRHARMVSVATGAMSEARAGLYPARAAAETLEALFADAVTTPMPGRAVRTPATARSEWRGILACAVAQAQVADLQAVRARAAAAVPADTLSFDAGAAPRRTSCPRSSGRLEASSSASGGSRELGEPARTPCSVSR
jgi:hypothetical protein